MKRTPVKKRRTKPRRGPMRDPKYRTFVRTFLCSVFSASPNDEPYDRCDYWNGHTNLTDSAHTQNNGMRSKGPDSSCAPLCRKHHREYDAGREAFEEKYAVSMSAIAAETFAAYLSKYCLVPKSD